MMPKHYETLQTILDLLADGKIKKTNDLPELMLKKGVFNLTQEEKNEKLSNGGSRFYDRVWWGTVYLRQGKFIERPARGMIKITKKGLDFLKNSSKEMTLELLEKDRDFISYIPNNVNNKKEKITDLSPNDLIQNGAADLNENLKNDLLEKIYGSSPYFFEKIVLLLFKKMGYGDFITTPKSRDGGIDGIINQDQLGIGKIYIQAKLYKQGNKVRELEIRNFIGAIDNDSSKGIFVTTSDFDAAAIQKVRDSKKTIILINGKNLVELMIKYNAGVQVRDVYEVKEIDEDFFEI